MLLSGRVQTWVGPPVLVGALPGRIVRKEGGPLPFAWPRDAAVIPKTSAEGGGRTQGSMARFMGPSQGAIKRS